MPRPGYYPVCVLFQGNDSPYDGTYQLVCHHQIKTKDFKHGEVVEVLSDPVNDNGGGGDESVSNTREAIALGDEMIVGLLGNFCSNISQSRKLSMKRRKDSDENFSECNLKDHIQPLISLIEAMKSQNDTILKEVACLRQQQEASAREINQLKEIIRQLDRDFYHVNAVEMEDESTEPSEGTSGYIVVSEQEVLETKAKKYNQPKISCLSNMYLDVSTNVSSALSNVPIVSSIVTNESLTDPHTSSNITGASSSIQHSPTNRNNFGTVDTIFIKEETESEARMPQVGEVYASLPESSNIVQNYLNNGTPHTRLTSYAKKTAYCPEKLKSYRYKFADALKQTVYVGDPDLNVILSKLQMDEMILKTVTPSSFAYKLSSKLFTTEEMMTSNTSGTGVSKSGQQFLPLNQSVLVAIMKETENRFPGCTKSQEGHRKLYNAINDCCRNRRKTMFYSKMKKICDKNAST